MASPDGDAGADPSLDAACDGAFDAMKARVAKCGPDSVMGLVPVEHARPSFKKLCQVQGSRPGTGYTAAFRTACAQALMNADCMDDDTVVKACWEPRGSLARGLPCNSDDQCVDGLCVLPTGAESGSSCGACGTPVWKELNQSCNKSDKDKCVAGTVCKAEGEDVSACEAPFFHHTGVGGSCSDDYNCILGLICDGSGIDKVCAKGPPLAAVGQKCWDPTTHASTQCELGAFCVVPSNTAAGSCAFTPGLDESTKDNCDSWTIKSATGKCIIRDALSCN